MHMVNFVLYITSRKISGNCIFKVKFVKNIVLGSELLYICATKLRKECNLLEMSVG